jgi:hypothetical protein
MTFKTTETGIQSAFQNELDLYQQQIVLNDS